MKNGSGSLAELAIGRSVWEIPVIAWTRSVRAIARTIKKLIQNNIESPHYVTKSAIGTKICRSDQ